MYRLAIGADVIDLPSFEELQYLLHGVVFGFAGTVVLSTNKLAVVIKFTRANSVLHRFGRCSRNDETASR